MVMKFRNAGRLKVRMKANTVKVRQAVMRELHRGGLKIEARAVEGIINPPKTGRMYRSRGSKKHMHQASAPGEFPAADTGELHTSIQTVPKPAETKVIVGTNTPYGAALEFGTAIMKPRPFMRPSFEEKKAGIIKNVRRAIRRANRT